MGIGEWQSQRKLLLNIEIMRSSRERTVRFVAFSSFERNDALVSEKRIMFSTSVAVLRSSEIRFVPFLSDCAETTNDSVTENPASSASFMFSAIADAVLSDEKNAAVGYVLFFYSS